MKTKAPIITALLGIALLAPAAAAPMNYQGRLTDNAGDPRPGPQATLTFSLWDHPSVGTKHWGDFQVTADLIDGRFSVQLGTQSGDDGNSNILSTAFGAGARYLELQVAGDPSPLPRQEILPAPTAISAETADQVQGGATLFVDGANDRVGIGTATPAQTLTLTDPAAQSPFLRFDRSNPGQFDYEIGMAGSGALTFRGSADGTGAGLNTEMTLDNGRLGIGETAPENNIHLRQDFAGFTTLELENRHGSPTIDPGTIHSGMKIKFTGFRDVDPNHEIAAIVARKVKGNFGNLDNHGQLEFYTTDGVPHRRMSIDRVGTVRVQRELQAEWLGLTAHNKFWSFLTHGSTFDLEIRYEGVFQGHFDQSSKTYVNASDRRLKEDIAPLDPVLDRVMQLEPSSYRWKDAEEGYDKRSLGFIAQDMLPVFPEVVSEGGDQLGISYTSLVPVNTRAIQELKREKDAEIASRDAKIADLEARLARLEKLLPEPKS